MIGIEHRMKVVHSENESKAKIQRATCTANFVSQLMDYLLPIVGALIEGVNDESKAKLFYYFAEGDTPLEPQGKALLQFISLIAIKHVSHAIDSEITHTSEAQNAKKADIEELIDTLIQQLQPD